MPRASEAAPWVGRGSVSLRPIGAKVQSHNMLIVSTFAPTGRKPCAIIPSQGAASLALGYGLLAFQAGVSDRGEHRLCSWQNRLHP